MKRRCTLTCHCFLDLPLTLYPSLPSPAPIFSLHSNFPLYPRILLGEIKELTGSERKTGRERDWHPMHSVSLSLSLLSLWILL